MPEYTGQIRDYKPVFIRPDLRNKWIKRNNGLWFEAKYGIPVKDKDPKSAEQLGYYWCLLVPETLRQLTAEGHTKAIRAFGLERDIPYNKLDAHEVITALCGQVGLGGAHQRLSECGKQDARKFIDNTITFAVANLGMNEKALKAWRPK